MNPFAVNKATGGAVMSMMNVQSKGFVPKTPSTAITMTPNGPGSATTTAVSAFNPTQTTTATGGSNILSPIKNVNQFSRLFSLQESPDNIQSFIPTAATPPTTTNGGSSQQDPLLSAAKKSFVERSMYKRDMCKNWTEAGFCRYGNKCQYAHGQEELSDNH